MNKDERLKEKYGTDAGYRVPDGYFDSIYAHIADNLPEQNHPIAEKISVWNRFRPYIYMAAMFAGIWCMMKVFHSISDTSLVSLDNPPVVVAEAMSMHSDMEAATSLTSALDEQEAESELAGQYNDIESFIDDFGYDLSPDYADMSTDVMADGHKI